jgi:hypothetical protein
MAVQVGGPLDVLKEAPPPMYLLSQTLLELQAARDTPPDAVVPFFLELRLSPSEAASHTFTLPAFKHPAPYLLKAIVVTASNPAVAQVNATINVTAPEGVQSAADAGFQEDTSTAPQEGGAGGSSSVEAENAGLSVFFALRELDAEAGVATGPLLSEGKVGDTLVATIQARS